MFGLLKVFGGGVIKALGGDIVKDIFGGVGDHFKAQRELKALKASTEREIELVKAKTISTQATADIDKNLLWVKQAETSCPVISFMVIPMLFRVKKRHHITPPFPSCICWLGFNRNMLDIWYSTNRSNIHEAFPFTIPTPSC